MNRRSISDSLNMNAEELSTASNPMVAPSLGLAGLSQYLTPSINPPAINKSENINEIAAALSEAQGELEAAEKGTSGYGYNYSDLASVIATAKPVLKKYGLAVVQLTGNEGDKMKVTTILTHKSGQFFQSEFSMGLVEMKGVNDAQKAGATISYMRRYAYQAILGMASEDSDASSKGMKSQGSKPAAPKKASQERFERNKVTKKVENDDDDI